jgi:hypothetical protein
MNLLAIDPGNVESAYVIIEPSTRRPVEFGKVPNDEILERLVDFFGNAYIEMIGHYGTGMPAGKTVFDTCVWIGRFMEAHAQVVGGLPDLILRPTVKAHICGSAKAKDPNVIQALVDRFAPGQPNKGKGIKAAPGWFYGFAADVWQAYALAVYVADTTALDGAS